VTASTERAGADATLVDLATAAPAEWMALSGAASWNQTEADWRLMLSLGHGWGLRHRDGELVASTLVLPYERPFAWISMVLVLPAHRGQGHAGRLLRVALDDLSARGLTPVLDATPAGQPVYLKQGFVGAWGFARWRCKAAALRAPAAEPQPTGRRVRPLRPHDWPAIAALDSSAFGADRLPLLRALADRWPRAAWVAMDGEEGERDGSSGSRLVGHLFGREGRTAVQIGPLVTADAREDIAAALLLAAISGIAAAQPAPGRDVIVDLQDGREALAVLLGQLGFAIERPFLRMVHGGGRHAPGEARQVVLVAGPELG
jgi:GNAT superfamily N-acetyltransferase